MKAAYVMTTSATSNLRNAYMAGLKPAEDCMFSAEEQEKMLKESRPSV
jgi:hypothetical protein